MTPIKFRDCIKLLREDPAISRPSTRIALNWLQLSPQWHNHIPAEISDLESVLKQSPPGPDWGNHFYYAGIGSRNTPAWALDLMKRLAGRLSEHSIILRSGHAKGADAAFEAGVPSGREKQIFLPFKGYQGSNSRYHTVCEEALTIADLLHPNPAALSHSRTARLLMARNCYQIMGPMLDKLSHFVICYTEDGVETAAGRTQKTGGTGQAIMLAYLLGIPVFNLARPDAMPRLTERVEAIKTHQLIKDSSPSGKAKL